MNRPFATTRKPLPAAIAAEVAIVGTVVACVLARGGGAPWALAAFAVGAVSAFAFTMAWIVPTRVPLRVPRLAAFFSAAILLCVAQSIPLPTALLDLASPAAAQVRDFALRPLG